MDNIIGQVANSVTTPAVEAKPDPTNVDVQNFEQSLDSNASQGLGDAILNKIGELKQNMDNITGELTERINGKTVLSPSDLLQAQMHLARFAIQEELIGKAIGRTNQNIETLIKTQ